MADEAAKIKEIQLGLKSNPNMTTIGRNVSGILLGGVNDILRRDDVDPQTRNMLEELVGKAHEAYENIKYVPNDKSSHVAKATRPETRQSGRTA